jgi:ATP-binding cassette subfamily B protein
MTKKLEKIDFRYNLNIYFGMLKKYNWFMFILLASVLLVEVSYVAEKFLFKIIIDDGTDFVSKTLSLERYMHVLLIVAAVFISLIIFRSLMKWVHFHLVNFVEAGLIQDLKVRFFNHILLLSHNFHTMHKTGSLISRLGRGGGSVERMTDTIVFNVAPLFFQLIVVSSSIIFFDAVAGITVFFTTILFVGYSFLVQRVAAHANLAANDAEDYEKAQVADTFTNIDSIKYFGKESYVQQRFKEITDKTKYWTKKNWDYYRWIDFGQTLILGIGLFFLVYFPMNRFLAGEISIGSLVFVYTVYGTLVGPLFSFVHGLREYYRVMADFESLFEYNKIEQEVKDKLEAPIITVKSGAVDFKNITFHYGKRAIFEDFSLKIPSNKKYAFVGHSGSGKSTLLKLLYRFYDIDSGNILIDNIDINTVQQSSLRGSMSIVPQECVLFDDTIYNNVAFSRPDATREEVMEAICFAQLDRIIQEFPNKENTIVGERGVKLSGGEKQRVSIARAILADKKILVLDEATSSLDSETEHEIQEDLKRLMNGRTTIIIAHRLSTIMHADRIIVLNKGRIVQQGTHKQLIRKDGEYKKLWNLQKGGYIK